MSLPPIDDVAVGQHRKPRMNDQDVSLKISLVNGILNYLGTRPYVEVFHLIQELQAQAVPQVQAPKVEQN